MQYGFNKKNTCIHDEAGCGIAGTYADRLVAEDTRPASKLPLIPILAVQSYSLGNGFGIDGILIHITGIFRPTMSAVTLVPLFS